MAVSLPNGSIVAIAATYGAVKQMTTVTNAAIAVATLEASHGVAPGDFVEVTSGWSRVNNRIVKAGTVTTNDVQLLGINSTSTSVYPAGAGVGSVREVLTWTQVQQVLSTNSEGGQQQFLEYQFLEDDQQKRIPTTKSAAGLTLSIADDPTLAGYIIVAAANDDRLPRAIRVTLPNSSIILYNAYVTLDPTPSLSVNNLMAVQMTLSFLNAPVRY